MNFAGRSIWVVLGSLRSIPPHSSLESRATMKRLRVDIPAIAIFRLQPPDTGRIAQLNAAPARELEIAFGRISRSLAFRVATDRLRGIVLRFAEGVR